jgi:hypothetical protein
VGKGGKNVPERLRMNRPLKIIVEAKPSETLR